MEIRVSKQIAVFLGNKPGTLARLTQLLSKEKVNIYAISTSDTIDHSVVRLVVDDPHRAMRMLEEHGAFVVDNDVLMIHGKNSPGSLARIAKMLADAKVNIEYAYCATDPSSTKGIMILRPDNMAKAVKTLNSTKV